MNKMNKLRKIFKNEYLDDENEKNDTIYDSVRMS